MLETTYFFQNISNIVRRQYVRVLEVLQNLNTCKDRNFTHWALKIKKFQIMDLPGLGVKDALVVPIKDTKRIS